MCQRQNTLNIDSSLLDIFVQMETPAALIDQLLTFSLQGQGFIFSLEIVKVFFFFLFFNLSLMLLSGGLQH